MEGGRCHDKHRNSKYPDADGYGGKCQADECKRRIRWRFPADDADAKSSAIAPQVVQSADNAGKIERAPQMENKRSDVSLAKQDDKGMAQTKDVKDKTDAFAKDVKDAIKDELDVTDEQIEKSHGRSGITIS